MSTPRNKHSAPQPICPSPRQSSIGSSIKVIAFGLLIALIIRTFFFHPFVIPTGSLIPTLLVGDYLFISKYAYGYSRYSLPKGVIPFNGRIGGKEPERGDLVVFASPKQDGVDYIKRVIGLPGDTVQMVDNVLVINGTPVKRERVGSHPEIDQWGKQIDAPLYREVLPNGLSYTVMEREGPGSYWANTFVYKVPQGHYFMMGDNRDNSSDSRDQSSVGYVPFDNLIGRAEIIFFSLSEGTSAWQFWKWPFAVRQDRLFKPIR